MGNICRSPLVEGVARRRFADAGIRMVVASCGTGCWHVGEGADPRSRRVAAEAGYDLESHRVRQLAAADYRQYDLLLAMDAANLAVMRRQCPAELPSRLGLFLEVAGVQTGGKVTDPCHGDIKAFSQVWM